MKYIAPLLLFLTVQLFAQTPIDANNFIRLSTASTADRVVSVANSGSLVYDTDLNRIFQYTAGIGWQELLVTGNVYVGAFIITGAGATSVTGIPFQPTSVSFVAHINIETFNVNDDNSTGNNNDNGPNNSFGTMNGFARDDGGATPAQQVIYLGASANSINDISRFASNTNAIGVRYGNQNGDNLGVLTAQVTGFTANGFNLTASYSTTTIQNEDLVVMFTAYR